MATTDEQRKLLRDEMNAMLDLAGIRTPSIRQVALAIADGSVDPITRETQPSVPEIARVAGLSPRTVEKAMARLEQAGLLLVVAPGDNDQPAPRDQSEMT